MDLLLLPLVLLFITMMYIYLIYMNDSTSCSLLPV